MPIVSYQNVGAVTTLPAADQTYDLGSVAVNGASVLRWRRVHTQYVAFAYGTNSESPQLSASSTTTIEPTPTQANLGSVAGNPFGRIVVSSGTSGAVDFGVYFTDGVNTTKLQVPLVAGNYSVILPSAQGAANTVLLNDGAGQLSWTAQGALAARWSSLTAPTAALTLAMANFATTFNWATATTGNQWIMTANALTTGSLAALSTTSTALSGTVPLMSITLSGANANAAVTAQALAISVTNTNATSGTNTALTLTASGATTANNALQIAAGRILSGAAQTWALPANTAASLVISDGTTTHYTLDTRTGVSGVTVHGFAGAAPTFASAAGATYTLAGITPGTITLTGTTGVTALNGLALSIAQPTVTDVSAVTVTTASTVYIAGAPTAGGSVTLTNALSLQVAAGNTLLSGNLILRRSLPPSSPTAIDVGDASTDYASTLRGASGTLSLNTGTSNFGGFVPQLTSSGALSLGTTGASNVALLYNSTPVLTLTGTTTITLADAVNFALNATTGTQIGTGITQKLAFYGTAPIAQRAGAAQAAVATTASTQTSPFGYTTSSQADGIVTLVNELRAALVALGLIKGAA